MKLKRDINKNRLSFYNEEIANLGALTAIITVIITTVTFFYSKWNLILDNFIFALFIGVLLIYAIAIFLYNLLKTPAEKARIEFKELIENKYYIKLVLRDIFNNNSCILTEEEVLSSIQNWYNENKPKRFSNIVFKNDSFRTIVKHIGVNDFKFILFTHAENTGLISVEEINTETQSYLRYTLKQTIFCNVTLK